MKNKRFELLVSPIVFIGELIPWKKRWWKVQLYDKSGVTIDWDGDLSGHGKAMVKNPVMLLEAVSDIKRK